MTLRELKDKKIFSPDIKDNDLIKICNEILKPSKEIKSMDFQLNDEFLDKVRYSKQMIDFVIGKVISNKNLSNSKKYDDCIKYLNDVIKSISKKPSMSEEVKYINQVLDKLKAEKTYYATIDAMAEKNKSTLIGVDPNNLTKLNKEALAVMMGSMLGNQDNMISMMNLLLDEIKKLNAKVDELSSGKTVSPLGELEEPPKPNIIPEPSKPKVANVPNGPKVSSEMPPLFPMGSLQDLVTRNILPKMDEKQLLDYCNNVLGMNAKDMRFVPSVSQLDRLKDSAFVSSSRIRSDIKGQHKGVAHKYDELISSYQTMIDDMRGKPGFENEIASLETLIGKISQKRDEYQGVINGFEAEDMTQYFQFGASRFQDKMSSAAQEYQQELNDIDENLKELMDRKKSLERSDFKHIFARMKNKRDLKKVVSKINKLKTKQGRIKTSQKKIVDIYTSKYVKKMEREFDKFVREQEKIEIDYQKKQSQLADLNERQKKMDKLNRKMVSIEEKRKNANKVVQVGLDGRKKNLESKQKNLQAKIDELQKKVGNVDLSKQYSTTFSRDYAYAL